MQPQKVKHEIVDEKEKQTMNVNSENVTARVGIGKGNVIANKHFRPCIGNTNTDVVSLKHVLLLKPYSKETT